MDAHQFDTITRSFALSRRGLARALAAAAGGLFLGRQIEATATCRKAGRLCAQNANCCSGLCDPATQQCACPPGTENCDGDCKTPLGASCASHEQCCGFNPDGTGPVCDPGTDRTCCVRLGNACDPTGPNFCCQFAFQAGSVCDPTRRTCCSPSGTELPSPVLCVHCCSGKCVDLSRTCA